MSGALGAAGAPGRALLAFGDSNTHGTLPLRHLADHRRLPWPERWPGVVAAALGSGWRVVEDGLPGRTTLRDDPVEGALRNGLPALRVALGAHRPLDVVALMLGTNDLKAAFNLSGLEVARSLARLLREVALSEAGPQGAAPRMLLILPPAPRPAGCLAEFYEGCEARAARLAELAPGVAADAGAAFLDASAVAAVSPVDGVHLEVQDHAAIGRAVAERIAEAFA